MLHGPRENIESGQSVERPSDWQIRMLWAVRGRADGRKLIDRMQFWGVQFGAGAGRRAEWIVPMVHEGVHVEMLRTRGTKIERKASVWDLDLGTFVGSSLKKTGQRRARTDVLLVTSYSESPV